MLINVLKVTLTATAADKSRTYGAANPPLTINYSGFVNGDTASALDSVPVASTTATAASPVGTYPIKLTGGADNDYNFLLVNGTLTVTPAPLTVMANNATKIYGQVPSSTASATSFGKEPACSSVWLKKLDPASIPSELRRLKARTRSSWPPPR